MSGPTFDEINLPFLPPNTIVPNPEDDTDTFIQYLNRLYEDIAFAVNSKDFSFFEISISSSYVNVPNLPNFGAYLLCVSGVDSTQPTGVWALCKSTDSSAGVGTTPLNSQAGSGSWAGNVLTINAAAQNFQIKHDRAGVTANFNIRIVGTQ